MAMGLANAHHWSKLLTDLLKIFIRLDSVQSAMTDNNIPKSSGQFVRIPRLNYVVRKYGMAFARMPPE